MPHLDIHLSKRSHEGLESECGDTGIIRETGDECFFALIDVLGHGREAHKVSVLAEEFLCENFPRDLVDLMNGLHSCLKGTRGAVAALCRLNRSTGELRYVGVGNINVRLFGAESFSFVPRDGIIGYMMSLPKEQTVRLCGGDLLILSSDGVREHFNLEDYPGLLTGSASAIASEVLERLSKGNDDASCIVLRYGK